MKIEIDINLKFPKDITVLLKKFLDNTPDNILDDVKENENKPTEEIQAKLSKPENEQIEAPNPNVCTIEEIRKLCTDKARLGTDKAKKIKEILNSVGAKNITELQPDKFDEIYQKVQEV